MNALMPSCSTALADAAPNWQWVMAGPIVKIDPASLPQRANVHWLGQQPYEVLPHLVAQWDVCLLPFARNESTRFISPTKTLEYMAGEKPIVSTPIHDVVSLYGDCVSVAATPGEFIAACAQSLAETAADREQRLQRMRGSRESMYVGPYRTRNPPRNRSDVEGSASHHCGG